MAVKRNDRPRGATYYRIARILSLGTALTSYRITGTAKSHAKAWLVPA